MTRGATSGTQRSSETTVAITSDPRSSSASMRRPVGACRGCPRGRDREAVVIHVRQAAAQPSDGLSKPQPGQGLGDAGHGRGIGGRHAEMISGCDEEPVILGEPLERGDGLLALDGR